MLKHFIRTLISSFGLKRQLAAVLQTVALLASIDPHIAPFASALSNVADWLGVTGLAHATVAKPLGNAEPASGTNIATIAAFFGALSLLAESGVVPQLVPFAPLIKKLVFILSPLAAGVVLGKATDESDSRDYPTEFTDSAPDNPR